MGKWGILSSVGDEVQVVVDADEKGRVCNIDRQFHEIDASGLSRCCDNGCGEMGDFETVL